MTDRRPTIARRWVRILLAAAIAGNLVGGVGALYMVGAGTDDLTVDEAITRFRSGRPTSTTPTPTPSVRASSSSASPVAKSAAPSSRPASRPITRVTTAGVLSRELQEGVYVFATEGYEETDALSGAHRDYDSQTAMSINRGGCGWVWRWQPAEERWDESEGCRTSAGIVLGRYSMYHEFFRRGTQEDLICEETAVVMPASPKPGQRWESGCRSDDTTVALDVRVVGFETVRVGGKDVRAVRIRYEGAMSGDNQGTQIQERWLALSDGLLLRIVSNVRARVAVPFGGTANYEEHYRLDLTSIEPIR